MNHLHDIRQQLMGLADPKYQQFSSSLIPNVQRMIGVRLPQLRDLARKISQADWQKWVDALEETHGFGANDLGGDAERSQEATLQDSSIGKARHKVSNKDVAGNDRPSSAHDEGSKNLRKVLSKGVAEENLRKMSTQNTAREDLLFEEIMLWGMVISTARCPLEKRLKRVEKFVPMIDNWSVCDSFAWHVPHKERPRVWEFIQPYFRSSEEFDIRFAVVMSLRNFTDKEHLDALLQHYASISHEGYYIRMGIAWAVSVAYISFPQEVTTWLAQGNLETWTHNHSIQKIIESRRVTPAQKDVMRSLKRR